MGRSSRAPGLLILREAERRSGNVGFVVGLDGAPARRCAMTIRPDYTHVSAKDQIASAESEVPETLEPARAALIARVLNGKLSATDGPFPETKEGPGGSILIDAGDREEEWAPATQRLCGAFKDTPHPLCPGGSTPSRGRHTALLVVVAVMVLASVPGPAGGQEWWVRFDGRV